MTEESKKTPSTNVPIEVDSGETITLDWDL